MVNGGNDPTTNDHSRSRSTVAMTCLQAELGEQFGYASQAWVLPEEPDLQKPCKYPPMMNSSYNSVNVCEFVCGYFFGARLIEKYHARSSPRPPYLTARPKTGLKASERLHLGEVDSARSAHGERSQCMEIWMFTASVGNQFATIVVYVVAIAPFTTSLTSSVTVLLAEFFMLVLSK